jgi:hypothetical protein
MAKGRHTGGKLYKVGHKNPGPGRPKLDPEIKEIRKLSQNHFIEIANKYLNMTKRELKQVNDNPETPMKELLIAAIIHRAILMGDPTRYTFLLDRLLGRIPDSPPFSEEDTKLEFTD